MDSTYSLANALQDLEKERYAANPYAIIGNSLTNALTKQIDPQIYTGNPWAAIGAQFGSSLLGSALSQIGANQVRGQMADYANELQGISEKPYPDQLEALKAKSEYQQLVPYFTEEEIRRQAAQKKAAAALQKTILAEALKPPSLQTYKTGDRVITRESYPPSINEDGTISRGGWKELANAPRTLKPAGVEGVEDELVRSALIKARQGEKPTPEELQALSRSPLEIQRIYDQAVYRGGVEDRFRQGFEFKEGQTVVGPYRPISESAPTLQASEAAKLRGRYQAIAAITLATEEMAKNPQFALTGEEAISNAMYNGVLMNTFRNATNSGANFTETEQRLIQSQIIPTLAGGRTLGALLMAMTGRDRQVMASAVIKALEAGFDAEMAAIGQIRPGAAYNPKQREYLEKSYGVSPAATPQGPKPAGAPSVPPRQKGETPAQYLKRIGAQ